MKKLCVILLSFASTTFAVLPPLAQSTREFKALLADPRFQDALGNGEMIQDILRTKEGFLVMTQNYALRVDVQYVPRETKIAGPAQFTLHFYDPIDVRTGELRQSTSLGETREWERGQ